MRKRSGPSLASSGFTKRVRTSAPSGNTPVATVKGKKALTEEVEVKYYDDQVSLSALGTTWSIDIIGFPVLGDGTDNRQGRVIKYMGGTLKSRFGNSHKGPVTVRCVLVEYNRMLSPIVESFLEDELDFKTSYNQKNSGNFKILLDITKVVTEGYGILDASVNSGTVKLWTKKFKRDSQVNFPSSIDCDKGLAWLTVCSENTAATTWLTDFRQYFVDV